MKQGSVVAKPGDRVRTGQKLGEVGQSGLAEFPHLHIGVKHEGKVVDPFTGLSHNDGCGKMGIALWDESLELNYNPVSIYAAGFSDQVPVFDVVLKDVSSLSEADVSSPILTFWVLIYGVAKGDQIAIEIRDPNGDLYSENHITQDKNKIRQFYYVGKKNTKSPLLHGAYIGHVTLTRSNPNGGTLTHDVMKKIVIN